MKGNEFLSPKAAVDRRLKYLSNLQLGRIWYKVILLWGAMHESRLMHCCHKKCLTPFRGASGSKQRTQPCKVGIDREDGPLEPDELDETFNTTHPKCTCEDGI